MNKYANPLDHLIECCEVALTTGYWKLDTSAVLNAKDELKKLRQSKKDLSTELFKANQEIVDLVNEKIK